MTKYAIEELIRRWAMEELTADQAIGQLLLHVKELIERVSKLEQSERGRRAGAANVE